MNRRDRGDRREKHEMTPLTTKEEQLRCCLADDDERRSSIELATSPDELRVGYESSQLCNDLDLVAAGHFNTPKAL
jgi:hypothetical protein